MLQVVVHACVQVECGVGVGRAQRVGDEPPPHARLVFEGIQLQIPTRGFLSRRWRHRV